MSKTRKITKNKKAITIKRINKPKLKLYSNPAMVQKYANRFLGKNVIIMPSTRHDKKYMVRTPEGKLVHFGQMGYEDWTRHQDVKRREAFRIRNKQWAKADKWTAAYLAYYLLW